MNISALDSVAKNNVNPVLIIDSAGVLGNAIAEELLKDTSVVLVTGTKTEGDRNLTYIPFKRKIPKVPNINYSKIFIVDDKELITRKSVSSFLSRAKENDIPFYFICNLRNLNLKFIENLANSYFKGKILIHGDLFDNKLFFDDDFPITKFLKDAREHAKIDVCGNGLSLSFPMSFEDSIKLIIKATQVKISQRIILLFNPHPITDISLANLFQKINPDIKVDFTKGKKEKPINIPKDSQFALGKYDIENRIKNLNLEKIETGRIIKNSKNRRGINLLKPLVFSLLIVIFLLLLPLLTTLFYSTLAGAQINSAKKIAENDDFDSAIKKAQNSITFYDTSLKISDLVLMESRLIGKEEYASELINKIQGARTVSLAAIDLIDGIKRIRKIYSENSTDSKREFSDAINSFKSSIFLIQKAKAEGNLDKKTLEKIEEADPFIELFINSSDELMNAFGFEEEKKYLILFQNNNNLRPSGGVIESYGILKIKDGKVIDFRIQKSDNLNINEKNSIQPQFPLRRYFGLKNLLFSEAGFDPDFVNNAITASNIYSLSANDRVDGVIGVDLSFARDLLMLTGPVKVEGFGESISEQNIYSVLQESENLTLGNVVKSLESSLTREKKISFIRLSEMIGKSINEKHLLFAFQNSSQQKIFTVNGWSGSIWDNRSAEKGKINDFIGISEANLGGNNSNYFVSRSVLKKLIILDDGKVTSKIKLVFKNTSKKENKTDGNYKNYLQLILPSGSRIVDVLVDDKKVEIKKAVSDFRIYESVNFKPPSGFEIDERREMGKSIFGFLFMIGPSEIRSITLSYILPYSVSVLDKSINYSLKVYKQPGIESYPMNLTFSIPQKFQILEEKESVYKNIFSDEDFSFTFSQK